MDELKKQINILIDKTLENKLHYLITDQKSLVDLSEGSLEAFKLIRLLIDTNLKFDIDKNFRYDNI